MVNTCKFDEKVIEQLVLVLTSELLSKQLSLYGNIFRMDAYSLVRRMTFKDDTANAQRWDTKRRVGRPRLQWSSCVRAPADAIATGHGCGLEELMAHRTSWEKAARSIIHFRRCAASPGAAVPSVSQSRLASYSSHISHFRHVRQT